MTGANRVTFTVAEAEAGLRLDQALAARVPGLSRRRARLLLDIGGVFVDGRRIKVAGGDARRREGGREPGRRARARDAKDRARGAPRGRAPAAPVRGRLRGRGHRRGRQAVGRADGAHARERPQQPGEPARGGRAAGPCSSSTGWISRPAACWCSRRASSRTACCRSGFATTISVASTWRSSRARFPTDVRVIDRPVGGRRAVTHVAIEERLGARATLLRCRLETGRTHQIRLHGRGAPVLGDPRYGRAVLARPPRMALHATRLAFAHPRDGRAAVVREPVARRSGGLARRLRP